MRKITTILISLCLLLSSGCNIAANSDRMVPEEFEIVKKHPFTVSVNESTGGRETNPLWTSEISNSAFTRALNNALIKSGVFQSVIKGNNANYSLNVQIINYSHPLMGIDFDVNIKTKWDLMETKTFEIIWSDIIKTTYRAKFTDTLLAAERLQKANEGSVRVNIKEGIKRLSLLNL